MKHFPPPRLLANVPAIGLSLDKVALALDVSQNTVLKMVEEGALPPPRIWHKRRIWRAVELDAALAEWPTDGKPLAEDAGDEWKARA